MSSSLVDPAWLRAPRAVWLGRLAPTRCAFVSRGSSESVIAFRRVPLGVAWVLMDVFVVASVLPVTSCVSSG